MDLYHGTINVETLGIPNIEYIYLLKDKYFGFFKNRLLIINKTNNIEYDLIYSENSNTKKYISLEDDNYILFDEITNDKTSSFFITNLDGSIHYNKNTINVYYQIIKLWDTQRYFGYFSYNSLFLMNLSNEIYRKYDLDNNIIKPMWASNFVFFNNSLWVLLLDKINYYVLHCFSDCTYYSKYFAIDFNNINKNNITISITNDNILHILIPTIDLNDTYHISKPIDEFSLTSFGDCKSYTQPADSLQLLLTNRNSMTKILKSTDDSFNFLSNKMVEKVLDTPITLENLTYLFKPHIPKIEISKRITITKTQVPNIYYYKSDNPIDYIKWIIDNYNNYTYKSVVFYSQNVVSIYNYLYHQKIKFNIDLNIVSQNYDNYCLLYNKLYLRDTFIYERTFIFLKPFSELFQIYSPDNDIDNYHKTNNVLSIHHREKFINILTQLNISIKEVLWSPFLFYKFDIRYLRQHSIEYWIKVLYLLENSKDIDLKFLLYSIFFII
jgi:hypothetical protein